MFKGILAISGQPGLFKLVSEGKNSIIVESLVTGKRTAAYSTARISSLEEISIFTETGEAELKQVLLTIKKEKNGAQLPKMDNAQMADLFNTILPEYDKDRVYASDMKKVFQWYNILNENNLIEESKEENKAE